MHPEHLSQSLQLAGPSPSHPEDPGPNDQPPPTRPAVISAHHTSKLEPKLENVAHFPIYVVE